MLFFISIMLPGLELSSGQTGLLFISFAWPVPRFQIETIAFDRAGCRSLEMFKWSFCESEVLWECTWYTILFLNIYIDSG